MKQLGKIKVVDFSIKFDKNFVSKKNFFHTHGFLTLEDALLTGPRTRERGLASWVPSKVKNHAYERNFFFKQSFYQIL